MKTKRVNLPRDVSKLEEVNTYLSSTYNVKGGFVALQESYAESRKAEETGAYNTNPDLKTLIDSSNANEAWKFFLYLAIGVKEAAYYLAVSFIEGFGVIKNEFLAYLCMAIGVALGDRQTIELVGDEPLTPDAHKLASQCVKVIKQNASAVGNKNITYEEAIGRAKVVDKIVKVNAGQSIEDNILPGSIKAYANFVALDDASPNYGYHSYDKYTQLSQPLIGDNSNNVNDSCCSCIIL